MGLGSADGGNSRPWGLVSLCTAVVSACDLGARTIASDRNACKEVDGQAFAESGEKAMGRPKHASVPDHPPDRELEPALLLLFVYLLVYLIFDVHARYFFLNAIVFVVVVVVVVIIVRHAPQD